MITETSNTIALHYNADYNFFLIFITTFFLFLMISLKLNFSILLQRGGGGVRRGSKVLWKKTSLFKERSNFFILLYNEKKEKKIIHHVLIDLFISNSWTDFD